MLGQQTARWLRALRVPAGQMEREPEREQPEPEPQGPVPEQPVPEQPVPEQPVPEQPEREPEQRLRNPHGSCTDVDALVLDPGSR